ncbi:hypothetical protein [Rhodococcus sp. 14-2470-1a]|uniref:hypothetical protein n=1 Tax=Rhodococcus sp. 14-2470-1a TaxID=2023150 RepID=UPI00211B5308|nr:hypothetical protein [Rhodococcus sp. 14-2470-1a]
MPATVGQHALIERLVSQSEMQLRLGGEQGGDRIVGGKLYLELVCALATSSCSVAMKLVSEGSGRL